MREQSKHLLKILNGPHRGAEVTLPGGETTLGSAEECDIILTDRMIAPKHARLTLRADGIALTPLADGVLLDGKTLTEARNKIDPFQYITLGSTQLILGPADSTWPALLPKDYTTPAGTSATAATAAAAAANGAASATPSTPDNAAGSEGQPNAVASPKKGDATSPAPALSQPPRARAKPPWIALTIALFFCAGIALFAYALWGGPHAPPAPDPIDVATSRIDALGLTGRIRFERRSARILAEGYCDTLEQRKQLLSLLADISPAFQPRIFSREGVANDARGVLTALGIPAAVTSPQDGVAVIRAIIPSRAAWERASDALKTDVPGLRKVDDTLVRTLEEVALLLREILGKEGLMEFVKIMPRENGFFASGAIPQEMKEAWQRAKAEIITALGAGVTLADDVHTSSLVSAPASSPTSRTEPAPKPADFRIESIVGGESGWLSLRNGRKYFLGAELPNGFALIEIKPDRAVLLRGTERLEVGLGEELLSVP